MIFLKHCLAIAPIQWDCKPGQGEQSSSNTLKEIEIDHLDSCKSKCLQDNHCKAIDYSNSNHRELKPWCRMYKTNKMINDTSLDNLVYCTTGRQCYHTNIIIRDIFSISSLDSCVK